MATLVKQDGRFYLQFYDPQRTPSRKKVPLKATRKGPAQAKQRELEDAYVEGRYDPWTVDPFTYNVPQTQKVTLTEAKNLFLVKKKADGRAENTLRTYTEILDLFSQSVLNTRPLEAVDAVVLHRFIHDPDVAPATRYKRFGHLRTFFRWCLRNHLIHNNSLEGLEPPTKPAKLPKAITESELQKLCTALRKDYNEKLHRGTVRKGDLIWRIPLFWFAYYTGMRASELARLRWQHIDQEKGLIYIYKQKNRREQTIPLNRKAKEVLASVDPGSERDFVFRRPRSRSLTRSSRCFKERASRAFREARNKAEINPKLSFHSLRHGFCTRLAEAGKPLYVIKEAARHADVSTSMIYVHMANTHLKAELDEVFG